MMVLLAMPHQELIIAQFWRVMFNIVNDTSVTLASPGLNVISVKSDTWESLYMSL